MREEDKKYILDNIKKKSITQLSKELNLRERKIKKVLEREKKRKVSLSKGSKIPGDKKNMLLSLALVAILGLAVYSNSLGGEFVWDDNYLVKNNVYIKDASFLPQVFSQNIGAGAQKSYRSFRPIQMLSYMIDYKLWGLNPQGYHLTSIILHILAAFALYFLVLGIFESNPLSLLTSILFVVHPIHSEAVAYISGRADSLAAIFIFLSFILYLRQLKENKLRSYLVMVLSFGFALLSRESSFIFPLVLLLYHFCFKKKFKAAQFFSLIGLVLIYALLRFNLLKEVSAQMPVETTLWQRMPGLFVALGDYLRLLILPLGLHMEYGLKVFAPSHPFVVSGILLFILIVFLALRRKSRFLLFPIGWFFIFFIPQSNIYPLTAYMAEHWMYLPSVGFFLVVAGFLLRGNNDQRLRPVFSGLILGLVIFYSCLTFGQNNYWRTPFTLYERTLRYAPQSPTVCNNLALLYHSSGHSSKAIALYQKAINIDPDHYQAYSNLGNLYQDIGDTKKAIGAYEKAIAIKPDYAGGLNNLGNLYSDMGNSRRAITFFKKALEAEPGLSEAYNNLGRAYYQLKENLEAETYFKRAIVLKPDYANAYNNLSVLYFKMKEYDLSIEYCDKARQLGFVDRALIEALKPYRNR